MRRSEAIRKLMSKLTQTRVLTQAEYESGLYQDMAERHLEFLEKDLGMRPPCLPEDHCQALMDVYYAGYTFYQWEEDFEKDVQAVAALKRRQEFAAMTPEERKARRRAAIEKLNANRRNGGNET